MKQALPVLTDYLKAAEVRTGAQIAEVQATVTSLTAELQMVETWMAGTYQTSLKDFLTRSVFQLQPPSPPFASLMAPAPGHTDDPLTPLAQGPMDSLLTPQAPLPLPSLPPSVALPQLSISSANLSSRSSRTDRSASPQPEPPKHRMSRAVKTVWDEGG